MTALTIAILAFGVAAFGIAVFWRKRAFLGGAPPIPSTAIPLKGVVDCKAAFPGSPLYVASDPQFSEKIEAEFKQVGLRIDELERENKALKSHIVDVRQRLEDVRFRTPNFPRSLPAAPQDPSDQEPVAHQSYSQPARPAPSAEQSLPAKSPYALTLEVAATKFNSAVTDSTRLADLARELNAERVNVSAEKIVASPDGLFLLIRDGNTFDATMLPGEYIASQWDMFFKKAGGHQARESLGAYFELEIGRALQVSALPKLLILEGDLLHIVQKGVLQGI